MNQNLAPQPKPNATLLLLTAWAIALVGYFGPWLGRPSAALAWNAYDLFDLLRLLPEIEAGALIVNLQALRLPLVGLAVLLPMMLANARLPSRLTAALLGIGLALTTLPSYPEIVRAWRLPGWRVPFWWGVGAMVGAVAAVWLAPRLGATRPWLCLAWTALTGIPATITLYRLIPALSRLHGAQIAPAWGFWTCAGGMFIIALVAWGQSIRKIKEVSNVRE